MNLIFTSFPLFKDTLPLLDSEGMSLLYAMMGKNDYTGKAVAYLKGTTAANTLFAAVIFSSKDREGAIHTLCVREDSRGKGLGTRLVEAVKAGCDTVRVNGIRTALGFYRKLGFIPVDSEEGQVIPLIWHRQTCQQPCQGTAE